jgi:hypothetical protein
MRAVAYNDELARRAPTRVRVYPIDTSTESYEAITAQAIT